METKANSASTVVEATEKPTISKKIVKTKSKTPGGKASHPPTSEMVTAAIKELKDRKGSSLQAIKKYIASTYKVDGEKLAPFIKRYLKSAVTSGAVVQTKGKGASGSFKLSTGSSSEGPKAKKAAPRPAKKAAAPKKTQSVEKKTAPKKSAAIKKPVQAKKAVAEKKAAAPKKTAAKPAIKSKATTEAKNLSKAKKSAKAPAAKTKTPKPKKAAAPKAAAKAVAKK